MIRRLITTILGIVFLVSIIQFAPEFVFIGVSFVAMVLALTEYFGLTRSGYYPVYYGAFFLASLIFFAFYNRQLMDFIPAVTVIILLLALFTRLPIEQGLVVTGYAAFGALYLGGLMGYLVALRLLNGGEDLIMMLFLIIWAGDIFAFLVGRKWGRHRLSLISPKKTVEGAIAGLVASVLAGVASRYLFHSPLDGIHSATMGAVVGIMGQLGDLAESLLKRSASVKDSGTLLPGHGGMLDRVDSLLFGAPAMYYYFYFFLRS